jgi:membrane-associated two-gene conflict system component 1 (EACC1)
MSSEALVIRFADASVAEGNQLANTLADALRDVDSSVIVDRQRERSDTQDFGASLAVMLGTAAATAVAKGIGAWLARNSGARIEIRRKGKVVLVATHLDSKDVPRIAEALSSEV